MVFPASQAKSFTDQTISTTAASQVQIEITLCEQKIRAATSLGLYNLVYDARAIGNPKGSPENADNLTDNQETFYTLLINAGYQVGQDGTGRWAINWSPAGPETLVAIYSFRTTVLPGAVHVQTVTAIQAFFAALVPIVHTSVAVTNDIDETDFGGVASEFYEYTIIADQEHDTTDHSADLKSALTGQGLGYNSGNCQVYKLI